MKMKLGALIWLFFSESKVVHKSDLGSENEMDLN